MRSFRESPFGLPSMVLGNMPKDGGNLILEEEDIRVAELVDETARRFVLEFYGSQEFVQGTKRYCLWIEDDELEAASSSKFIADRLRLVAEMRRASPAASTRAYANRPHRFKQIQGRGKKHTIIVPSVTSERRQYLPVGLLPQRAVVSSLAFALYDAPLWNMALIASCLHLVWIATVCGKLKTDFRYSNTNGLKH